MALGRQYAALANQVYGVYASISLVERGVMRFLGKGEGVAWTAKLRACTATRSRQEIIFVGLQGNKRTNAHRHIENKKHFLYMLQQAQVTSL